jgi:hypothetical protein
MYALLSKLGTYYRNVFKLHTHSFRQARNLRCVQDHLEAVREKDLLAVIVLRNEAARIPFFLRYYRRLGVDHFLFIDNDSTDDLMLVLSGQKDCSVWHTTGSYKESRYGIHWANHLLRKHGSGHWCLTLDPDEFLVYPHMDSRNLRELTDFLDQEGKDSFFTIMLDMYGKGTVDDAIYQPDQDPLEVCSWFDPTGFYQDRRPNYGEWWIRGGVRRRVYFPEQPWNAPALNKTVLVKWKRYYSYIASAHIVWPNRLNRPHFHDSLAPTGCLLHFKYLSLFREKVEEEMERKEHYAGSREYVRYLEGLNAKQILWSPGSAEFEGWRQCVDLGLMNTGRWF